MVTFEFAKNIIFKKIKKLNREKVNILLSINRIIDENIKSKYNLPNFDNSSMDGYAVRSIDTIGAARENPVKLKIIDVIPAGKDSKVRIVKNTAALITTGAKIPKGADAVIIKELTKEITENGEKFVYIYKNVKKYENIRKKGEDVKKGEIVIKKGSLIRPQEIALLTAINVTNIYVIKQPKVAILTTGSELVSPGKKLLNAKIFDSNSYAIVSFVQKYGGITKLYGPVKDDKKVIKKFLKKLLENTFDMIIISGGVSVGNYDFVKDILNELGVKKLFWKVLIKPGKPFYSGIYKNKFIFGLPGNPAAVLALLEMFIRDVLLKMQGKKIPERIITAYAGENIQISKGRVNLIRAKIYLKDGKYLVKPSGMQSSGMLKSFVNANALIITPSNKNYLNKGEKVNVEYLGDWLIKGKEL
jgi:molybdopterin molybdotransferase